MVKCDGLHFQLGPKIGLHRQVIIKGLYARAPVGSIDNYWRENIMALRYFK